MMNEAIVEKVKALIAAPSCYAGLKKIAEEYGISKSTMERRVKYLLQQIVDRLNPE